MSSLAANITASSVPVFGLTSFFGAWDGDDYTSWLKALVAAYGETAAIKKFWAAYDTRTFYNTPALILSLSSNFKAYAAEIGLYDSADAPLGAQVETAATATVDFATFFLRYGKYILVAIVLIVALIVFFQYEKIIKIGRTLV